MGDPKISARFIPNIQRDIAKPLALKLEGKLKDGPMKIELFELDRWVEKEGTEVVEGSGKDDLLATFTGQVRSKKFIGDCTLADGTKTDKTIKISFEGDRAIHDVPVLEDQGEVEGRYLELGVVLYRNEQLLFKSPGPSLIDLGARLEIMAFVHRQAVQVEGGRFRVLFHAGAVKEFELNSLQPGKHPYTQPVAIRAGAFHPLFVTVAEQGAPPFKTCAQPWEVAEVVFKEKLSHDADWLGRAQKPPRQLLNLQWLLCQNADLANTIVQLDAGKQTLCLPYEGIYEVTVALKNDPTVRSTILIAADGRGPDVEISAPGKHAFVDQKERFQISFKLTETFSLLKDYELHLNGRKVGASHDLSDQPKKTIELNVGVDKGQLIRGMNILKIVSHDIAGNRGQAVRSFLFGSYQSAKLPEAGEELTSIPIAGERMVVSKRGPELPVQRGFELKLAPNLLSVIENGLQTFLDVLDLNATRLVGDLCGAHIKPRSWSEGRLGRILVDKRSDAGSRTGGLAGFLKQDLFSSWQGGGNLRQHFSPSQLETSADKAIHAMMVEGGQRAGGGGAGIGLPGVKVLILEKLRLPLRVKLEARDSFQSWGPGIYVSLRSKNLSDDGEREINSAFRPRIKVHMEYGGLPRGLDAIYQAFRWLFTFQPFNFMHSYELSFPRVKADFYFEFSGPGEAPKITPHRIKTSFFDAYTKIESDSWVVGAIVGVFVWLFEFFFNGMMGFGISGGLFKGGAYLVYLLITAFNLVRGVVTLDTSKFDDYAFTRALLKAFSDSSAGIYGGGLLGCLNLMLQQRYLYGYHLEAPIKRQPLWIKGATEVSHLRAGSQGLQLAMNFGLRQLAGLQQTVASGEKPDRFFSICASQGIDPAKLELFPADQQSGMAVNMDSMNHLSHLLWKSKLLDWDVDHELLSKLVPSELLELRLDAFPRLNG